MLADRFRPRAIGRAEFVYLEGDTADTMHVAAHGRIKILRETAEGKQVILRLIQPGEAFGVSGGWGGSTYPASAQALDPGIVLALPARALRVLLEQHPQLALALIQELGSRLREADARILDLQTEGADARIARALLRIAGTVTAPTHDATRAGISLTRQDLALLSGSTLSTASRALSAWHRRGIVGAFRERVVILDRRALEEIAGV